MKPTPTFLQSYICSGSPPHVPSLIFLTSKWLLSFLPPRQEGHCSLVLSLEKAVGLCAPDSAFLCLIWVILIFR